MKIAVKRTLVILLSFLLCALGIGYAALSTDISLHAEYIVTSVKDDIQFRSAILSDSTAASGTCSYLLPTNLLSVLTFDSTNSVIVCKVTAENTSKTIKHLYTEFVYDAQATDYNGNAFVGNGLEITVTNEDGTPFDTVLLPATKTDFLVTYRITNEALANTEFKTLLSFRFGVHADSAGQAAVDNATDKFEEILNDAPVLNDLLENMELNAGNTNTGGYIGNVAGNDTSGDSGYINGLFTDENGQNQLKLTASDGTQKEVTCIIKSESVALNNTTLDVMTIYMTPDEITGTSWFGGNSSVEVDVYAAVFYQNNGTWVQLGNMYEGKAKTNYYDGYTFGRVDCNSFNTDEWRSVAQTYEITDAFTYQGMSYTAYSYTVQASRTVDAILSEYASTDAWNSLTNLLQIAQQIDLSQYVQNATTQRLDDARNQAQSILSGAQASTLQAQVIPALQELREAITPFLTP